MSREPIEIIKQQLGSLMADVAILTAELEKRDEKIAKLEKLIPKDTDVKEEGK